MKSRSANSRRRRAKKNFKRKMRAYKRGKSNPKCTQCGTGEDLEWGPDPFSKEVNEDYTPVWLCKKCYECRKFDI